MTQNLKYKILSIIALTLVCVYGIIGLPTSVEELKQNFSNNIRLGLDLKGGSHLVMQIQLQDAFKGEADTVIQRLQEELRAASIPFTGMTRNDPATLEDAEKIEITITGVPGVNSATFRQIVNDNYGGVWNLVPAGETDYHMNMKTTEALVLKADTLSQTMATIERKINGLGLSEATVQQRGGSASDAEVLVQLPGVDDPARIKQLLKTAAKLELFEVQGGPYPSREEAISSRPGGILPLNAQIIQEVTRGGVTGGYYVLARTPVVRGRDLRNAQAMQGTTTRGWETTFVLTQDAAKRFDAFTGSHIGQQMAIVLDGKVLSAPVIQSRIADTGSITGLSGQEEAVDLATNLRAGSLPAGLEYLEQLTVGASLGADSIRSGLIAGVSGVIAVVVVMLVYYKGAGINATVALILNALILIACLSYFGAVLTLPGIAGVILTIGMAVDSNVLIFERIREELHMGKAVVAAVDIGFNKAFLTIIDTHVTTVVSCAFLFLFGTTQVKGFAVTLVIGLLANIFTAVFVSRTMFDWSLSRQRQPATISI